MKFLDLSTKKQLSLWNQYNNVQNPNSFINDNLDHRMIRVLDMDCSSANNILLQVIKLFKILMYLQFVYPKEVFFPRQIQHYISLYLTGGYFYLVKIQLI